MHTLTRAYKSAQTLIQNSIHICRLPSFVEFETEHLEIPFLKFERKTIGCKITCLSEFLFDIFLFLNVLVLKKNPKAVTSAPTHHK